MLCLIFLSTDELWQPNLVCWCRLIHYELECPANSVDCCLQYSCSNHTQKRKDDCLLISLCLPILYDFLLPNIGNVVMSWSLIKCKKFGSFFIEGINSNTIVSALH